MPGGYRHATVDHTSIPNTQRLPSRFSLTDHKTGRHGSGGGCTERAPHVRHIRDRHSLSLSFRRRAPTSAPGEVPGCRVNLAPVTDAGARRVRLRISPRRGHIDDPPGDPIYDLGCRKADRRDLSRPRRGVPGKTGTPAAASSLRPTGAEGAGLTEIGAVAPGLHVTVQHAPFIRKSSVCVAHSRIGPGRSSLTIDAAARRPQSSTPHPSCNSKVKMWSAGPGVVAQPKPPSAHYPSDDPATDLFFVLLVAPLLFERFRRLLGRYLTGRLVGHVCPLSSPPAYSPKPGLNPSMTWPTVGPPPLSYRQVSTRQPDGFYRGPGIAGIS
jgi:hypothetical protein